GLAAKACASRSTRPRGVGEHGIKSVTSEIILHGAELRSRTTSLMPPPEPRSTTSEGGRQRTHPVQERGGRAHRGGGRRERSLRHLSLHHRPRRGDTRPLPPQQQRRLRDGHLQERSPHRVHGLLLDGHPESHVERCGRQHLRHAGPFAPW
ncbi:unnamed protein product, partial [Scytosiphon promiscuus]